MKSTNLKIMALGVTALSLNACQKTKTKEVVRPESPWYQLESGFQEKVSGEAQTLTRGTTCLQTDAQFLRSANLLQILSGEGTETIIDMTVDYNAESETLTVSKTNQQMIFKRELESLFVCNPQPGSTNLEGVATYAANDLKAASDWYTTVTGSTLPAVELHIHPLETLTLYKRFTEAAKASILQDSPKADVKPSKTQADEVDNAYWTLRWDADAEEPVPVIAVYPHSSVASEKIADHPKPLWELPFVLRHEYGHHVFYNALTPLLGSAQIHLEETLAANPSHHSTRAKVDPSVYAKDKGKAPLINTEFLFGALNEGFADMYSFYASGLQMPGIDQAPCFVKTRDVTNQAVGGLDVKKVVSADMIDVLFNPKSEVTSFKLPKSAACNGFDLLEIHDLGAVFAYTVDKVFDASPSVQGLTDSKAKAKAKTKLALDWLANLGETLDLAESGPAVVLADVLESAALTAAGPAALTADAAVCTAVKTHFPGLKSRWTQSPLAVCFPAL